MNKMKTKEKLKIQFLCTGNSCRSQMAEAWTKKLKGDVIDAYSAGTVPMGVDPRAVKAMAEVGIDISTNRSKSTVEYIDMEFDYVITLCDNAQQSCPFFRQRPVFYITDLRIRQRLLEVQKTRKRPWPIIVAYVMK